MLEYNNEIYEILDLVEDLNKKNKIQITVNFHSQAEGGIITIYRNKKEKEFSFNTYKEILSWLNKNFVDNNLSDKV